MKPSERIFLDDFFQLHGRHLYSDEWDDNAIYFLNTRDPDLSGLDVSDDEIQRLKDKGDHLNKMAVRNAIEVEKHFIKHRDRVYFSDNHNTSYEYHGEIVAYEYQDSKCICKDGSEHLCKITLKTTSEFVEKYSVDLFDPDVSANALGKYKQILVSEAIFKYLNFCGMPANNEDLFYTLKEDFRTKYSDKEKFNDSMVRENIKRMLAIWHEIKK